MERKRRNLKTRTFADISYYLRSEPQRRNCIKTPLRIYVENSQLILKSLRPIISNKDLSLWDTNY